MTAKLFIFLALLSVLVSCTGNTIYEKPNDLIPKDSMVLLLKELYLATSAKGLKNVNLERNTSYIPLVYQIYKIDSSRFNRSNFYYVSKIDVYEAMLNKVGVLLKKEQTGFKEIKQVQDSILNDSLKKIYHRVNQSKKRGVSETFLSPGNLQEKKLR